MNKQANKESNGTLRDEVFLKLGEELQVQQIIGRQSLLSHHCLHGLDILPYSITGILHTHRHTHTLRLSRKTGACSLEQVYTYELVGDVRVVSAGHSLPDGGLHETGERRKHIDGRIDLSGGRRGGQVRVT